MLELQWEAGSTVECLCCVVTKYFALLTYAFLLQPPTPLRGGEARPPRARSSLQAVPIGTPTCIRICIARTY